MPRTRDEHLFSPGPKRILALDGGGIRGILTVQVLRRIEDILRARHGGDPAFRLCDYFDLIGGTSTGSIIAACLATGMSVDQVQAMYESLGNQIFDKDLLRWGVFRAKFSKEPLEAALKAHLQDITVGDAVRLKTGFAAVLKRMDTCSPWVVHNNPRGKYFAQRPGGSAIANGDFPLWQIVRSSTAAPHYFDPELFPVAGDANGVPIDGAFVDGGVSPHNNPALQLLMLAWLKGYALDWPVGADQLLLVSVGTGRKQLETDALETGEAMTLKHAVTSLASLMDDAGALNETLLQWMSASPTARRIDRELGDLAGDFLGGRGPLLTYARYDAWLTRDWMADHGLGSLSDESIAALARMDEPKNMPRLIEVGQALARDVEEGHFPRAFDLA